MSGRRRGSSLENTTSMYSKMIAMQSNVGLDLKRSHYRRMSETKAGGGDSPAFDPLEEPINSDKATLAQTYFTFFKSYIGIGVLALPHGFLLAGSVLGCIMISVASLTSYHCINLLLDARDTVEKQIQQGTVNTNVLPDAIQRSDDDDSGNFDGAVDGLAGTSEIEVEAEERIISYSDIGRAAYGSAGAKVVDFAIVTAQMGFSTAYLIFIGSNVEAALGTCIGSSSWAVIAAVLVTPLVWLRSLKKLSFGAILADVAIVFGLIVILIFALINSGDVANRPPQEPSQAVGSSPFIFFGTAVFAFEGAGMVLPMKQSMAEPALFPKVLKNGLIIITVLYVVFPLVVYVCYGSTTHDMITKNLPCGDFVVILVQLGYSVGLYFTYPIMMWPAIEILECSRFYQKFQLMLVGKTYDDELVPSMIFRAFLVVLTLVSATTIPQFGTFVAIIGSVSCSLIAFILPALFHLKLHPEASSKDKWIKWGLVGFGALGGAVSLCIEVADLVQSLGDGSVPDQNCLRCFGNGTMR